MKKSLVWLVIIAAVGGCVPSGAIAPDGKHLAKVKANSLEVYDPAGQRLATLGGGNVRSWIWSQGGRSLVVRGRDSTRRYDLGTKSWSSLFAPVDDLLAEGPEGSLGGYHKGFVEVWKGGNRLYRAAAKPQPVGMLIQRSDLPVWWSGKQLWVAARVTQAPLRFAADIADVQLGRDDSLTVVLQRSVKDEVGGERPSYSLAKVTWDGRADKPPLALSSLEIAFGHMPFINTQLVLSPEGRWAAVVTEAQAEPAILAKIFAMNKLGALPTARQAEYNALAKKVRFRQLVVVKPAWGWSAVYDSPFRGSVVNFSDVPARWTSDGQIAIVEGDRVVTVAP